MPHGDPSSEDPADWRGVLARRYDHLRPLHQWMPVPEAYHWADPVEDADLIPANSERYIVLAIRYEDATYLDYSQPGPPGVSVVDFQRDSERSANSMHFADVESFLAAVRRRPDLTRRR